MSEGAIRPLAGRTIIVTRPADQSAALVTPLERRGARVIVAPAIELVPARSAALTRALNDLAAGRFTWITITSRATVDMLASRLQPGDVRSRVAAIGEGSAAAFRSWAGREVDLQPTAFTTEGLARAFPKGIGRVLCARADIAPEGLEAALRREGVDAGTGRRLPNAAAAGAPPRRARSARRWRGRRGHVHQRVDRPWLRWGARHRARRTEGRLHRTGHGEGSAGARAHGARGRAPPYLRGRGRRGGAGAQAATAPLTATRSDPETCRGTGAPATLHACRSPSLARAGCAAHRRCAP